MIPRLRSLFLLVVLALLVSSPGFAGAVDTPRLEGTRDVRLDGTRIVGLSPDGTKIAVASFDMKQLCIYDTAALAKGACADLSPLKAGLRLSDVVWSPDSTKLALAELAFVRLVDGDLWVMDAANGELTDITDDGVNARIPLGESNPSIHELFVDGSPAWLPDSSGITFSRSTWRDGNWMGNTIETVSLDGGAPVELTRVTPVEPGIVYFGMRWTADGSRLFYSYNAPEQDDPNNGIWVVNADGSEATLLLGTDPERGDPIVSGVSPDGNTVLAFYARYAGQYSAKGPYYALFDVATRTTTPLELNEADAPDYAFIRTAVLSPDGRYVLCATRLTNPDHQILLRPVAGGEDIPLVPEGLPGAVPIDLTAAITWADNGTLLLNYEVGAATLLTISGVDKPAMIATPVGDGGEPSPVTSPSAPAADFSVGGAVIVNDNDVPLRAAPSTDALTVETLAKGTPLTVIAAPITAEGFTWVPVTDPATGTLGYVRAEFLTPSE